MDAWRRTPHVFVAFSGALAVAVVLLTDYLPSVTGWRLTFGGYEYQLIDLVGKTASLAVLLAFLLVNAAVVALRLRERDIVRHFKVPLSVRGCLCYRCWPMPLVAVFVAVSFADWVVWTSTALTATLGFALYRSSVSR